MNNSDWLVLLLEACDPGGPRVFIYLFYLGCFLLSLYHLYMVGWWYPHFTSLHGSFVVVLLSWWDVSISYAVTHWLGMHGFPCLCWPLFMSDMVDGFVAAVIMVSVCRWLVALTLRGSLFLCAWNVVCCFWAVLAVLGWYFFNPWWLARLHGSAWFRLLWSSPSWPAWFLHVLSARWWFFGGRCWSWGCFFYCYFLGSLFPVFV